MDRLSLDRREEDVATSAPGPGVTDTRRDLADRDRRSAPEFDPFQTVSGEEADRLSVR